MDYLIEVLISIKDKRLSYDINSLNNSIFQYFFNNGIKKLISIGNQITIGNNISIKLYPIKSDVEQNNVFGKIIAVNFRSSDQQINYPIEGIKTDKFSTLGEKLFYEFPELKNRNIFYIANGNIVNRDLTLEKNNIKSGTTILIQYN